MSPIAYMIRTVASAVQSEPVIARVCYLHDSECIVLCASTVYTSVPSPLLTFNSSVISFLSPIIVFSDALLCPCGH